MFKKVVIGTLLVAGGAGVGAYYTRTNKENSPFSKKQCPIASKALANPNEFYQFKLVGKDDVTHDVRRYRFELPDKNSVLGIHPGEHVVTKAKIGEKVEFRPYSPTSDVNSRGHFDVTFKVYPESSKYPGGGKMSRYLDSLKVGDQVDFKGPVGRLKYYGKGSFGIKRDKDSPEEKISYKNIGMVAGGTGITPLYQIAKTISQERCGSANAKLVFSNHTENDIIIRAELDELEKKSPEKFKAWYTVTKSVLPNWKYDKGHVTLEMLKKNLPPPSDDTLILVCGPPDFVKKHCIPLLVKIGHSEKNVFGY